ncbi:LacI family transcriptional regulator [Opitutaceae bacterium TAV5]|nr:LacI family transcriptional regulator [Opitutaceae bacterium TAV5]
MITLKHIAAEAGATIATVSMALRGSPLISVARRVEINEIARRLGYQRNAHVSTLMKHIRQGGGRMPRKAAIAFLMAHPSRNARKEFVFVDRRFRGMEVRLAERGYRPDFFWYNDPDMPPERLEKIWSARGIRGAVLALFREFEPAIELDWEKFAVATQSDFSLGPPIHRVMEDYFTNTVTAMRHLRQSGCRRIGLAYSCVNARSARFHIAAAYHESIAQVQGSFDNIPSIHIPDTPEGWTEQAFMAWFRREKPDAVLTFNWYVRDWLLAAGKRIPEDVSIAVLNRCPSSPEFSGIDPQPELLGETSVDLVIEQLENNECGLPKNPKVLTIPGRWVQGTTTREP